MGKLSNPERMNTKVGELIVQSEELSECKDDLELQFVGKKLDKKDWFGSSDPFLQISRANERPGDFTLVHRTEHINNNVFWTIDLILRFEYSTFLFVLICLFDF